MQLVGNLGVSFELCQAWFFLLIRVIRVRVFGRRIFIVGQWLLLRVWLGVLELAGGEMAAREEEFDVVGFEVEGAV